MYQPCRLLYQQLMEAASSHAGEPSGAARSFRILVDCNKRGECPERGPCRDDIDDAFAAFDLESPFAD